MRLAVLALDEAPFHPDRKTGPATTAQVGSFDFSHDFLGLHLECFSQRLVSSVAEVAVERSVIILPRGVFQDHALFRRVRGANRFAVGPVGVLHDTPGVGRPDALGQLVADQRHRGRAAAGEAFDELDGVFAVGAGHAVAVVRHVQGTGAAQQFIADFMGSGHGAGQGTADSDCGLAGRSLAEPGIERDQL